MHSKEHVFGFNVVPLKKSMSVRDLFKTLITKVICFRFFNICSLVSFLLCAAFKNKAFVGNETLIPNFLCYTGNVFVVFFFVCSIQVDKRLIFYGESFKTHIFINMRQTN